MPGTTTAVLAMLGALTMLTGILSPDGQPPPQTEVPPQMQWSPITRTTRPWTRWWWLGSAVDKPNLTRLLETYRAAGLGGVEITPIYGIKGQEARHIAYLTPQWVAMLQHTLTEAKRLDLGVDMPTGTGWPFGGPDMETANNDDKLVLETGRLAGGTPYEAQYGTAKPQGLLAVSETGQRVSLLEQIDASGRLHWTPPPGNWTLYTARQRWSGMKVKRAAPGSEGRCINPFSKESLAHYLARFEAALSALPPGALRCHFHDSFEYAANWAGTVFDEFLKRRGYDLRDHLDAMAGGGTPDAIARVRTDYRETIGDMLRENFTEAWTEWAHRQGSLSRNQAHGSPGNLLDLYGTADIPETEVFRSVGDIRVSKFASSAAHVLGKPLVSSESCTWQGEHFTVTLAQAKQVLDRLLLSGINHIFYHGTAYSPADAAWPGWLFYASTDFVPTDPIWHDFPALNAYITRCQSVLQAGKPANDVLLYWNLSDLWMNRPKLFQLPIEGHWLTSEPIAATAQTLWERGFGYDYVSDRQIQAAQAAEGNIRLPGGTYRVIVVPPSRYLPEKTLQTLLALAKAGATVVFVERLPEDVPGLANLTERRKTLHALLDSLTFETTAGIRQANVGSGRVVLGNDVTSLLTVAQVPRETLTDHPGLMVVRRTHSGGHHYFLVNQGKDALDDWIEFAAPAQSAVLMEPMSGRVGRAQSRAGKAGSAQFRLQLQPGESLIVRAFTSERVPGADWHYLEANGEPVPLNGNWSVSFVEGGPNLPGAYRTETLTSWTDREDPETQRFAGTARYTLTFDAPHAAGDWLLDLGTVRDSARVRLNGQEVGTLIAPPYRLPLGTLKKTGNVLEIDVTNVAANRIRDLDRRKVEWRLFQEINFVNIDYKPFDASGWAVRPAGLLGPVRLFPVK